MSQAGEHSEDDESSSLLFGMITCLIPNMLHQLSVLHPMAMTHAAVKNNHPVKQHLTDLLSVSCGIRFNNSGCDTHTHTQHNTWSKKEKERKKRKKKKKQMAACCRHLVNVCLCVKVSACQFSPSPLSCEALPRPRIFQLHSHCQQKACLGFLLFERLLVALSGSLPLFFPSVPVIVLCCFSLDNSQMNSLLWHSIKTKLTAKYS